MASQPLTFGESPEVNLITWSVVPDGTLIQGQKDEQQGNHESEGFSNLRSTLDQLFGSIDAWMPKIEQAVAAWDRLTGLRFVQVADDGNPVPVSPGLSGSRGHIRFAGRYFDPLGSDGPDKVLAYATSRELSGGDWGDIVINTRLSDSEAFLPQLSAIVLHELGHVIGLQHTYPTTGDANSVEPHQTKIMEEKLVLDVRGPQPDDIWEAQSCRGDNSEPNDSIAVAFDLGQLPIGTTEFDHLSIQNRDDVDVFRFRALKDQTLTLRLIPVGSTYRKGYSSASIGLFNSLTQNDLQIELLDATGQSLSLGSSKPAGEAEMIDSLRFQADGEFIVRVLGQGPNTQSYRISARLEYATDGDAALPEGDVAELRQQIEAANQSGSPTTIDLAAGIYRFDRPIAVQGNVTIQGVGPERTILDGQGMSRIFESDTGGALELESLTLANGKASGNGGAIWSYRTNLLLRDVTLHDNAAESGGAIYAFDAIVELDHVTSSFNRADKVGGALYVNQGRTTINNSSFSYNVAGTGGAVSSYGDMTIENSYFNVNRGTNGAGAIEFGYQLTSRLDISNSWIIGNVAAYGGGLGLGSGVSTLTRVEISDNVAEFGGGGIRLAADGSKLDGTGKATLVVDRSLIERNSAGYAGGVASNLGSEATLLRSWIRQNAATSTAGGIGTQGRVRVEESTVSENRARDWFGGGVASTGTGDVLIINSTVSSNFAENSGSGVTSFDGARVDVLNSTIVDNELVSKLAKQGAGIHVHPSGHATITNSIVADNRNGDGLVDIFGDVTISHSLLGAVDSETASQHQQFGNLIGDVAQPLDPKLGPLADNGGATPTHRLLSDSPALNAGISVGNLKDQRGNPRLDGRTDLGAFEDATIPRFENHPPTLDPIVPIPMRHSRVAEGVVELRNIGDGDNNRQSVVVNATSDNLAVIPTVTVGQLEDGSATLHYSIAPGTSGLANIEVEVTDAGADSTYGTSDDLSTIQSLPIRVVNGPVVEAETAGTPTIERGDASGDLAKLLGNGSPIRMQVSVETDQRWNQLWIRTANRSAPGAIEAWIGEQFFGRVDIPASDDSMSWTDVAMDGLRDLAAGPQTLELRFIGSSGTILIDQVGTQLDEPPRLAISDAFVLEPRAGEPGLHELRYTIHLSRPVANAVELQAHTVPQAGPNHAMEILDYTPASQFITFAPGETSKVFSVTVPSDTLFEDTEQVLVALDGVTGATLIRHEAIGYIFDTPIAFGNPTLPPIRPRPATLGGIFVNVHSTGPATVPPRPRVITSISPFPRLLVSAYRLGDVNRDGFTSPLDVLLVVNYLNQFGATQGNDPRYGNELRLDLNRDESVSAIDVYLVIAYLNDPDRIGE